jgi:anti-sigma B factor antagonist
MVTSIDHGEWAPFHCEVEPDRGSVRVTPHGELDIATVPELERRLRELRESGFDRVVLDLRRLGFMDSTGLRLVMREDAAAREDGRTFAVVAGSPAVQRVFELAGVTDLLEFSRD